MARNHSVCRYSAARSSNSLRLLRQDGHLGRPGVAQLLPD
jgi:hypothetical protein